MRSVQIEDTVKRKEERMRLENTKEDVATKGKSVGVDPHSKRYQPSVAS